MKDYILTILSSIGFAGVMTLIVTVGLVVLAGLWLAGVVK